MSITIIIGEAALDTAWIAESLVDPDDELCTETAYFTVRRETCSDAPTFLNDTTERQSNRRVFTWSEFNDFIDATGLDELLDLIGDHPDCVRVDANILAVVSIAKERYLRAGAADKVPGWYAQNTDPHLAILIWFEWWMIYALSRYNAPALENL